jgi:hypothetical protein
MSPGARLLHDDRAGRTPANQKKESETMQDLTPGRDTEHHRMDLMAAAFDAIHPVVMRLRADGVPNELIAGQLRVIANALLGIED